MINGETRFVDETNTIDRAVGVCINDGFFTDRDTIDERVSPERFVSLRECILRVSLVLDCFLEKIPENQGIPTFLYQVNRS